MKDFASKLFNFLKQPIKREGKGRLKMTQNDWAVPRYNENIKLKQRDFSLKSA